MAKINEQKQARELRKQGWSLLEIANKLHVAKSSVSNWVRNIKLTPKQKKRLDDKRIKFAAQGGKRGNRKVARKHREIRQSYQQKGYEEADYSWLHVAGCMLYWAEGTKGKNAISFSNSDKDMHLFFLRFLREYYNIKDNQIRVHCNTAKHANKSVEEIEEFWMKVLGLSRECFVKTTIAERGIKKIKHKDGYYGVCRISVNNTELVQKIYGSIKKYAGININDERWLGGLVA